MSNLHLRQRLIIPCILVYNFCSAQVKLREEPHHKIIFENEYIRLFEGRVAAGDTTLPHLHETNSVVVFLSESTFGIKNAGENQTITTVHPGDMIYRAF